MLKTVNQILLKYFSCCPDSYVINSTRGSEKTQKLDSRPGYRRSPAVSRSRLETLVRDKKMGIGCLLKFYS